MKHKLNWDKVNGLIFHLLVLLRQCNIDLVEVLAELQDRTKQ